MSHPIEQFSLAAGAHATRDHGMCAMEMVAWLAGEPHSDEPLCACPVLGSLVRAVNDTMSEAQRNRYLRPLVPKLIGTRATAAVERVRGLLVVDALVRTLLPMRLRRDGRPDEARLLADLPPITRLEHARTALRAVEHFALRQHATQWVLARAVEGTPAARFVAGAVQVAKSLNDPAAWTAMVGLIERMVEAVPAGRGEFAAGQA